MKYIFIVNPISGSQNSEEEIRQAVSNSKHKDEAAVYVTTGEKDATRFVVDWCLNHEEDIRFIACGGDGTINEVANGIMQAKEQDTACDISLSCYPCGSGNDLVKSFGGAEKFLDIEKLMDADAAPIDMLKVANQYSINIVNFGFDTTVADTVNTVRAKKGHAGKKYYLQGVIKALVTSMRTNCTLEADGEILNPDGAALLCTIANGQYVGGSYHCAPRAIMNDGLCDICMVKPVSRFKFIQCVKSYSSGQHLDDPRLKDVILYKRAKKVVVTGEKDFAFTLDGEIIRNPRLELEVIEKALNFAAPK